ncbi:hypothetical protein Tco_0968200 [Tanacetum coccineum]
MLGNSTITQRNLRSHRSLIVPIFAQSMGLWYSKDTGMSLTAYADADHARCQDTRRSTSGSAQFLGDKLVSWYSKKQKSTAISITEAEYIALFGCSEPPKSRKRQKKSDSAISSEESPSKKSAKSKKVATTKPKPTKNKAPVKADRGKGLNVLSEVALSEAAQLKEVTKQSKKDFHIPHASGSTDGADFESGVPDEQHRKTSGADEGIGIKPGFPDVPKYDSESRKESWGDSGKGYDDDENDSEDESDNDNDDDDGNDDNDGDGDDDDDANDNNNQEDDDTNDDDEETDSDRTKSDIIKILVLN